MVKMVMRNHDTYHLVFWNTELVQILEKCLDIIRCSHIHQQAGVAVPINKGGSLPLFVELICVGKIEML